MSSAVWLVLAPAARAAVVAQGRDGPAPLVDESACRCVAVVSLNAAAAVEAMACRGLAVADVVALGGLVAAVALDGPAAAAAVVALGEPEVAAAVVALGEPTAGTVA